jgi:hypothetical protein
VSASAPIHVATINVCVTDTDNSEGTDRDLQTRRYDGRWNNPVPIPNSGAYNPPALPSNPYAEQAWAVRRSRLVDALLSTGHLDIIGFQVSEDGVRLMGLMTDGFQEVLHNQLHDLEALLGPRFGHVGVGRDDGKTRGEYSPIFYDQ